LDIWWNVKSNFVFLVSSGVPTTINYHKLILDVEVCEISKAIV